jgi:adenylylsulfate kinase-like enzyme
MLLFSPFLVLVIRPAINLDNIAHRSRTHGRRLDIITQIYMGQQDAAYWLTGLANLGKTNITFTDLQAA